MENTVKVSVFCLAYNHEKYLRRCLEGFVTQKTNFPFEVLIHDDASTDGTADIIREYEEKYPNIIKPLYQTQNQYSQGIKITKTHLKPRAQGEYFAWCEGDDYWTDCNKLQKQVDFLDSHPEYACCYHRVRFENLRENSTRYIPQMQASREFTLEEIVKKGAIFHLSAQMMRRDVYNAKPESLEAKGFGDVPMYIFGAISGKVWVMEEVMSVYNHGVEGSYTLRMKKSSTEKRIAHEKEYKALLERFNEYTNYQYNNVFAYAIDRLQFSIYRLSGDRKKMRDPQYREFYKRHQKEQMVYFKNKYLPFLGNLKKMIKRS